VFWVLLKKFWIDKRAKTVPEIAGEEANSKVVNDTELKQPTEFHVDTGRHANRSSQDLFDKLQDLDSAEAKAPSNVQATDMQVVEIDSGERLTKQEKLWLAD
jgi:hypothetical protein